MTRAGVFGDLGRIGRPLAAAEWAALLLLVALTTGGLHAVAAPGFMSFDSLLFYRQALTGIERSTWPPMYTYLIQMVRAAGGDYGTLFLLQWAMIAGFGGYLALRLSEGGMGRRLLALGVFFAGFWIVPPLLGTALTLWNVVPTAGFLLAGLAFQVAAGRGRVGWSVAAVIAYAVAFALRYNAVFLVGPLVLLLLASPAGERSGTRSRGLVLLVALLAFAAAFQSFSYRLPDLKPLPFNAGVRTLQTFDLIGISARCGESFLTAEMTAKGPVSVADIQAHYDPRHLNISMMDKPGAAPLSKPFDAASVAEAWGRAVRAHPGCYVTHRLMVFAEQMGAMPGGVFYATHGGVDPNPYGYRLAHPERAAKVVKAITEGADQIWRRQAWLYLIAAGAVVWMAWRRDARAWPLGALVLGAWAYAGSHLAVAAAADARYIFPASVPCLLVIAIAAGGRARRA